MRNRCFAFFAISRNCHFIDKIPREILLIYRCEYSKIYGMEIVDASVAAAKSYASALDEVAREGKWLAVSVGFSLDECIAFIRRCKETKSVELFLMDGDTVAGWCDVVPAKGIRTGSLGIGLRRRYRGKGYGAELLDAAIEKAARRFDKVVLYVREDNDRAINMYLRRGFVTKKIYSKGAYKGLPERVLMMVRKFTKKERQ